jgi:hypothetical protein
MKILKKVSSNQLIPGRIYRDTDHDDYIELRFIKKINVIRARRYTYVFEAIDSKGTIYVNSIDGLVHFKSGRTWYEAIEVLNVKEGVLYLFNWW